jgi:hypothetical protein
VAEKSRDPQKCLLCLIALDRIIVYNLRIAV